MVTFDHFEKNMLVELKECRSDGITLQGNLYEEFNNIYGIAHGGYLYTVAHIAARMTGDLCIGGKWEIGSAEALFQNSMKVFPSVTKTKVVSNDIRGPVVRAEVYDGKGTLCFNLVTHLCPPGKKPAEKVVHTPTIITDRHLPQDPNEKPQFPCLSSTFSRWLDIYSTSMTEETITYTADLSEANCDDYGFIRPEVMFTAADCAAGGCLFYIDKRRPITVSANIHYVRPTCRGPVHAIAKPLRKGRVLNFYDVDLVDGDGKLAAVAQLIIRDLDYK